MSLRQLYIYIHRSLVFITIFVLLYASTFVLLQCSVFKLFLAEVASFFS